MHHRAINPGLHHRWRVVDLLHEALRPGAGLVVLVPIEGRGQLQAVRGLQAEAVDVGDEDQQPGELLAALDDAEFRRLLDRVDRVATGIGEADDLGLRGLRLEQVGGEIRGVERHLDRAQHLAAAGGDDRGGVAFERVAEGVIGGDEEPGIAAGLDHRAAGAVRQRNRVVGPMNAGWRAGLAGQVGGGGAGDQERLLALARHVLYRQRDARSARRR